MGEAKDPNDRQYTNGEITVFWKPSKCIHATTCYRELIEVFNPRKRPWVNMSGASTDEIIRVVDLCPTKALSYKLNSEMDNSNNMKEKVNNENEITPNEIQQPVTEVRVMKDGPLLVKGNFRIIDANGNEKKPMKIASFCRCGKSGEMPFCDGSHRKERFTSD